MAYERGFEEDNPRFDLYKTGPGEPFEPTPEEREFESLLGGAATSDVVEQTSIEQSVENMATRQEHTFTQPEATTSNYDEELSSESEEAYAKELLKYGIDPTTIPVNDRLPRHLILRARLAHAKADGLQRNEEQTAVPQTISHLEAFVAVAFDECNLSSEAARNHALAITKQHKGQAKQLFVVDPDTEPQTVTSFEKLIPLPRITLQYGPLFTGSDEQMQLVLDATNTNNLGQPKPVILAVINEDIAIPLASFEKRMPSQNQGMCVHAQLGQEISNESIVYGPADVRRSTVEAFRALLELGPAVSEESFYNNYDNVRVIEALLRAEAARYKDRMLAALEPSAAASLLRLYNTVAQNMSAKKHSVYWNKNSDPELLEAKTVVLAKQQHTRTDMRSITLLLLQPQRETTITEKRGLLRRKVDRKVFVDDGPLHLVAQARSNVLIPIASVTRETGRWQYFAPFDTTGQQPDQTQIVVACKELCDIAEESAKLPELQAELKSLEAQIESCKRNNYSYEHTEQQRRNVKDLIVYTNRKLAQISEKTLKKCGVEEIVADRLGAYDMQEEKFINRLFELRNFGNGKRVLGVQENIMVHGRREDISVARTVKDTPRGLYVHIEVKPVLVDGEYITYYEEIINPALPLQIQNEKLTELLQLLQLPVA